MAGRDLHILSVAQRLLAREAGGIRDSEHLTEAARSVFHKLRQELVRLIGPAGYRAILTRSFRLTQAEFPSVSGVEPSPEEGEELKGLIERIQTADYIQAEEIMIAVLVEFLGVLTEFFGWDLSSRFVLAAWPELALGEEPESESS